MTISDYVNYGLWGLMGLALLFGIIRGYRRGFLRSTIRTILLIGCAVLSLLLTRFAAVNYGSVVESLFGHYLYDIVGILEELTTASSAFTTYIIDVLFAIVSPVMYLIFFFVLRFVTWILYLLILIILPKPWKKVKKQAESASGNMLGVQDTKKKAKKKKKKKFSGFSRLLGVLISVAGALILFVSFIMPISGTLNLTKDLYQELVDSELLPLEDEAVKEEIEEIIAITNHPLVKMTDKCGGKYLFERLTELGDSGVTVEHEVQVVIQMIPAIQDLQNINFSAIFDAEETVNLSIITDDLLPLLHESERMEVVLAEVISIAATKWEMGEMFLGVDLKGQFPEQYATTLDGVLKRLKNTMQNTVVDDLNDLTATVVLIDEAFTYMSGISNSDKHATENLQENMREIINDLTPGTAELLGTALSKEMIGEAGLSDENSVTVQNMITSALVGISEKEGAEREAESDAIHTLISYTSEERRGDVSAEDVVDVLLTSDVIQQAITDEAAPKENGESGSVTISATQKASLDAVIEEKKQTVTNAEDLAFLETLSNFFRVAESMEEEVEREEIDS